MSDFESGDSAYQQAQDSDTKDINDLTQEKRNSSRYVSKVSFLEDRMSSTVSRMGTRTSVGLFQLVLRYVLTAGAILVSFNGFAPVAFAEDQPLALMGTITGRDFKGSLAVIENRATDKRRVYRVGDAVMPGIILESINNNQVVIRIGDETRVLRADGIMLGALGTEPESTTSAYSSITPDKVRIHPDYWSQNLAIAVRDLSRPGIALPVVDTSNQAIGVQLISVDSGSLVGKLGLRNDDIVSEVNGAPIAAAADLTKQLITFAKADRLQIKVQRRGRSETLQIMIQ